MKVFVDGDGCPVVRLCETICKKQNVPFVVYCDTAHAISLQYGQVVVVDSGADMADFAIMGAIQRGDVLVTQDYALAAMALGKGCVCINQDGREYTNDNIDFLLLSRHENKKLRRAGGRTKGPKKRTDSQDRQFEAALAQILTNKKGDA